MILTRAQRRALRKVYLRMEDKPTYRAFRRTVVIGHGCIMLRYCNMWLGIEPDGYTHS